MSYEMPESEQLNYLFVCGTARSGTTAMTKLLNRHPQIVLGVERYKYLKTKDLGEHLFMEDRFFDFRPTDTNVRAAQSYVQLREKFSNAAWIGDKVPRYYTKYEQLFEAFRDSVVIFMLRDIHAVASSWNRRAENPEDDWPEANDYTRAVEEWNLSLTRTLEFKRKYKKRLFVVEYEKLFSGNFMILRRILRGLNLPVPKQTQRQFKGMTRDWQKRSEKPLLERPGQAAYLNEHADLKSYAKLKRLAISEKAPISKQGADPEQSL